MGTYVNLTLAEPWQKPPGCAACAYRTTGSGFVPTWVGQDPKVAFLLEAPGQEEMYEREPLVGAAGKLFFKRFVEPLGYTRNNCIIANVLMCFDSTRTMIMTPSGYKEWRHLKVDDLVLTARGRYKRILQKLRLPVTKFKFRVDLGLVGASKTHLTVSEKHLFLVEGLWKSVEDLQAGMRVTALGEPCVICGALVVRSFRTQFKSLCFCSHRCHNIFVGRKNGPAVSQALFAQYANGVRDPQEITKAAHEVTRRLWERGEFKYTPQTPEAKHRSRVAAAVTRSFTLKGRWIGKGEDDLALLLSAAEIEYERQFPLAVYNYDFRVGNVLIEVDGPGTLANQAIVNERNALKKNVAESAGFSVVHVPYTDLGQALHRLQNDSHDYLYGFAEVLAIKSWEASKGQGCKPFSYTLTVEEDETYVAQGIVSHNCRPPGNFYPTGKLRVDAERSCRQYDGSSGKNLLGRGLDGWDPNWYTISYHPAFILRSWSLLRVLASDIERAFRFAEQGKRPLVLLGEPAMHLVRPSIQVGPSKIRGHFGDLDWAAFKERWK